MDRDLWFGSSGTPDAEIVLVGEAWGYEELAAQRPFVGSSGIELRRMLAEAGIDPDKILMTNVVAAKPPGNDMWRFFDAPSPGGDLRGLHPTKFVRDELDRLHRQLAAHPRRLVIGTGNYPLWALTNVAGVDPPKLEYGDRRTPNGIMTWRGSMWHVTTGEKKIPYLPIIHPAAIMRQWSNRAVTVHDLKARVPLALRGDWRPAVEPVFWAPPTFEQARLKLSHWLARLDSGERLRLVSDIETAKKLITCIGFADSTNFAMCIPFVKNGALESYWPIDQEITLLNLMRRLLSHPNLLLEGQNFIYDTQYIHAYMGILPRLDFDTMLAHHMLWPGTPKALDYIASLYCHYYWYWKEDGKEWDGRGSIIDLLSYNCMDCIRTFECAEALRQLIPQLGMDLQWEDTKARADLALRMMLRGILIDRKHRSKLGVELVSVLNAIYTELETIIPQRWLPPPKKGAKQSRWYRSPKQQQYVFGELLGMKIPKHRKTGRATLGKDAMNELPRKYPEFTGLFKRLEDARSVAVFQSHFVEAELDGDNRMRCSFNPAGTETFRWSSSTNAFGRGTNLQNIPKGDEE